MVSKSQEEILIKLNPQYFSTILFGIFFMPFGCIITYHFSYVYTICFLILALTLIFYSLSNESTIEFYDKHLVMKTFFNTKDIKITYGEIFKARYQFGASRGNNYFSLFFKTKILNKNSIAFHSGNYKKYIKVYKVLQERGVQFEVFPLKRLPMFQLINDKKQESENKK